MLFEREEKPGKTLTPKDVEKCPICKTLVNLAEETACLILRKSNPNLDINACKNVLHMKLEGRSVDEIAHKLHVPKTTLIEAISKSVDVASEALKNKK